MLVAKFAVFITLVVCNVNALAQLEEVFAWKKLSFAWPSQDVEHDAIRSGYYVPENNLPLGLSRWKDKMFVTIPRWKKGVPTSLGYICLPASADNNTSPVIFPYPSWEANALTSGHAKSEGDNHIASTFRVAVDKCDRLWVLDCGLVNILDEPRVVSPPAVLIYDLNTNQLIRRYELDHKVLKDGLFFEGSFFPNIIVDSNPNRCHDAYAYLPDVSTNGLIVYSLLQNRSWRFEHHFFHFDPLQGNFFTSGENFQWNDGIFGVALGPEDVYGYRTAYFHPSASLNEFSVNTAVLKNESLTKDPHNYYLFKFEGYKGEKTQTTASVFDEPTNTVFFAHLNKDAVGCWNPRRPLNPENVGLVAQDHEKLAFSNEIRIDDERNLWILSNKMPKFIADHLNNDEINYRIFKVKVDNAIAGTPCVA